MIIQLALLIALAQIPQKTANSDVVHELSIDKIIADTFSFVAYNPSAIKYYNDTLYVEDNIYDRKVIKKYDSNNIYIGSDASLERDSELFEVYGFGCNYTLKGTDLLIQDSIKHKTDTINFKENINGIKKDFYTHKIYIILDQGSIYQIVRKDTINVCSVKPLGKNIDEYSVINFDVNNKIFIVGLRESEDDSGWENYYLIDLRVKKQRILPCPTLGHLSENPMANEGISLGNNKYYLLTGSRIWQIPLKANGQTLICDNDSLIRYRSVVACRVDDSDKIWAFDKITYGIHVIDTNGKRMNYYKFPAKYSFTGGFEIKLPYIYISYLKKAKHGAHDDISSMVGIFKIADSTLSLVSSFELPAEIKWGECSLNNFTLKVANHNVYVTVADDLNNSFKGLGVYIYNLKRKESKGGGTGRGYSSYDENGIRYTMSMDVADGDNIINRLESDSITNIIDLQKTQSIMEKRYNDKHDYGDYFNPVQVSAKIRDGYILVSSAYKCGSFICCYRGNDIKKIFVWPGRNGTPLRKYDFLSTGQPIAINGSSYIFKLRPAIKY